MKIAISAAAETGLDAPFDGRFGRATHFIIVDPVINTAQSFANPAFDAPSGAGTHAAQFVAEKGVQVVISGHFGPKAERALAAADIQMFLAPSGEHTVSDVLERYQASQLEQQGN